LAGVVSPRVTISTNNGVWPSLPLAEWRDTCATLQLWTQIAGKVRLALAPMANHWWQVPLYVNARGLTTSPMPYRGLAVQIDFDFIDHRLVIATSGGRQSLLALEPRSTADFYRAVMSQLAALGIDVAIWTMPVEIADAIPFEQDRLHGAYDPDCAHRFWQILVHADRVLKEFRGRFLGKASPVHFFWGSFDLAVTRFSGRKAPERPGADPITREAYSHEVSSAGFWPGGGDIKGPAFYSYAAPEPSGLANVRVRPEAALYHPQLKEFLLMYDDVRGAADPRATLMEFLQSTYDAAAAAGEWDREALERRGGARR
jgi:hypothetical protein